MDNKEGVTEFENQNQKSLDKIKLGLKELKEGLNKLDIDEIKLTEYLNEVSNFEILYQTRLDNWKVILKNQRNFHERKLEALPDKIAKKENSQKEQLKQLQESYKQLNEKFKLQKEELAVLKIAVDSYKFYEKRYFDMKYKYDELRHNTGNFHKR